MRRTLLVAVAAVAGLSLLPAASPAQEAKRVAVRFSPLPERVATADAVVIGKVTAMDDKTVSAEPFAGAKEKVEFQVATVKIESGLLGTKKLTHIKVGTIKPPEGRPVIRPGGGYGPPKLSIDQEGIFFLQKHPTESFYVLQGPMSVVNKANNDKFDKEAARVKECAKLLADPKAGLKSKDADDRSLTASMLLVRYGTPRPGQTKREEIDAGESKLILKTLAEADWNPKQDPDMPFNNLSPQWGFNALRLTDKDGFVFKPAAGAPATAYEDTAKAWLKDHADTYRVQRYVSDKKDKDKDEKKDK